MLQEGSIGGIGRDRAAGWLIGTRVDSCEPRRLGGPAWATPQAGRQASAQNVGCVNRGSCDDIIMENRVSVV
jgi:hypothetical protein